MMEKLTAISIPNGYARDEISEISDFALRPLGGPAFLAHRLGLCHWPDPCPFRLPRISRQPMSSPVRQDERRHGDCSLAILGGFRMMDERRRRGNGWNLKVA
jgi:hypothetical protein